MPTCPGVSPVLDGDWLLWRRRLDLLDLLLRSGRLLPGRRRQRSGSGPALGWGIPSRPQAAGVRRRRSVVAGAVHLGSSGLSGHRAVVLVRARVWGNNEEQSKIHGVGALGQKLSDALWSGHECPKSNTVYKNARKKMIVFEGMVHHDFCDHLDQSMERETTHHRDALNVKHCT